MSTERTATAQVEVAVDPPTAFKVFTEEMDRWWVQGPINFWDSARAFAIRCESGVGGRLIEVYDKATGEGLELGRITRWEPGELLAWQSSIDDVETTVRFSPVDAGTRVVVEAYVPEGGRDEGGSSWVRVAPSWFAAWSARRGGLESGGPPLSRLALTVNYARPATAARWLESVVGLESTLPIPDDDSGEAWIEFHVGGGILVVLQSEEKGTTQSHVPWIFVDDLEAHYASARVAGGKIIDEIHQHGYRAYELEDPEGHHWTIAQALPSMRQHP